MPTLREIWESKQMRPVDLAAATRLSVPTIYKANKKEKLNDRSIRDICNVLGISRQQYDLLEPEK